MSIRNIICTVAVSACLAGIVSMNRTQPSSAVRKPVDPAAILVIPRPKSMIVRHSSMPVTSSTALDIESGDVEAGRSIQREVSRYESFPLKPGPGQSGGVIVVGVASKSDRIRQLLARAGIAPSTHAEGYVVDVEPTYAVVAGHDAAGTFYGAQTLCQLLRRRGAGLSIAGVRVDDYPTLPYRGAHIFCGADALPFHERLVDNVFVRFKMNNLVLQCEQAKWDALGAAAPRWAMPKPLLKRDIDNARAHFMTVTPLVESVGHMGWLLSTPENRRLAEDPSTPYAAAVNNVETDRKLFAIYDEVLSTFHSDTLHIGGDEVVLRGRYPLASAAKYPDASTACSAQMIKLHDYLARKNVKTMMWADMLLPKAPTDSGATSIRLTLPRDIVLADWHYEPEPNYPSVDLLRGAGYSRVIGSTWVDPVNVQSFARSTSTSGGDGILETTWCGYESSARNLNHDRAQFVAFVLAAEEAWNGGAVDVDALGYDPAKVFDEAYVLPTYP